MHSKEMIMNGLQELHDSYDCQIYNFNYRGALNIIPNFTVKQISEKVGRTPATIRKWCKVLQKEGLIQKSEKRRYSANDPITYLFWRTDSKKVQLEEY